MPLLPPRPVSQLPLRALLAAALCLALGDLLHCPAPSAQNHPELEWSVSETDHFKIYFHQGLESVAGQAAAAAEEAYGPITSLYGLRPDGKVRIVLKDTDDDFNGFAAYYDNKIEILVTPMDYEYRGSRNWIADVVTHEFTHIVSLRVAGKTTARIPAVYLQFFGYQNEKDRKDVLTGYPDKLMSYALPTTIVPPWFAEGVAQYQASGARHDRWDTHRDMILRVASLNDDLLSYNDLGLFEKTSRGNEMVYDHGYSLVRHIADRYGEDKLRALLADMSRWRRLGFDASLYSVLGVRAVALYSDWKSDLRDHYEKQVASLLDSPAEGELWSSGGFSNHSPVWSPKGDRLAYLSNKGGDNLSRSLIILDTGTRKEKRVSGDAVSSPSWSPDGARVVYSKRSPRDRFGSRFWDLYTYNVADRRGRRLTHGLRAVYPDCSPDGRSILFVQNGQGNNNLATIDTCGRDLKLISDLRDGTQLFTPRWSPDGRRIVCSVSKSGERDIVILSRGDETEEWSEFQPLVSWPESDERDPSWSNDGKRIVFSSDATGIFNIYELSVDDGSIRRLTDVIGGGFSPALSPDGASIAYSLYGKDGYEIRVTSRDPSDPGAERYGSQLFAVRSAHLDSVPGVQSLTKAQSQPNRSSLQGGGTYQDQYPDASLPTSSAPAARSGEATSADSTDQASELSSHRYTGEVLNLSLMPRIAFDEGRPKLGFYAVSGDLLDKQNLMAGAMAGGRSMDSDLFLTYEYRRLNPTLFLSMYRQTRRTDDRIEDRDQDVIVHDATFALNQADLGINHTLWGQDLALALTYSRYNVDYTVSPYAQAQRHLRASISETYLSGFDLALTYHYRAIPRRRDSEINPRGGRDVIFRYDRQYNFFFKGFNQDSPILDEEYDRYFYNQLTLDWKEYLPLPARTTLMLRGYGGFIDREVDPFFYYRLGGVTGMKGYTYYSIEGNRAAMGTALFRFPISGRISRRLLPVYLDKLYGAVYADVGKAWSASPGPQKSSLAGSRTGGSGIRLGMAATGAVRSDIGASLRLDAVSFYGLPTRIAVDGAYGLDERAGEAPLKWYLTILFGYIE